MARLSETLRHFVFERAEGRCEYCLIHNDDAYMPHEVDHIYSQKHSADSEDQNLCLSCAQCNRYKGSDLSSLDPLSQEITRLFHPRRDIWQEHFDLTDALIEPRTALGRVTVKLLRLNEPERILERELLLLSGRYPRDG